MRDISKSKYLAGMQCPKLLWTYYRKPRLIPPPDPATQAMFDQGHEVGALAQRLFPGGLEVDWNPNPRATVRQTADLLRSRRPIFEASFSAAGVYARADILDPAPDGAWDLIEVKSSTGLKDIHVHDLAVQRYCYESAGLRIRQCRLMHINPRYVRQGDVDPVGLFGDVDATAAVDAILPEVPGRVQTFQGIVAQSRCPDIEIGLQCSDPYECPMRSICWREVDSIPDNLFTLYRLGARAWPLFRQGIRRNRDLTDDVRLSGVQKIQIEAERTGRRHVDRQAISAWLSGLDWPLRFLDFETFAAAIPRVDGTRPYQPVPFQFSLHVQPAADVKPRHESWIWDGTGDPREILLRTLGPLLAGPGSILVYNAAFERACLRGAAEAYPEAGDWVEDAIERMADLLLPFRGFRAYDPAQHGSASLKAVLPAFTSKSYADMEIADGGMASSEYARVMFGGNARDYDAVLRRLEEYCGLDTYGMILILEELRKLT